MVCYPRVLLSKVVPAVLIPELRQADVSVDVVERRCPRCPMPLGHGLPTMQPPQPQWCHRPAQHVPVRRADSCRVLSYNSVRELAAQPHVAHLSDRVLDAFEEEGRIDIATLHAAIMGAFSIITVEWQGPWAPAGP